MEDVKYLYRKQQRDQISDLIGGYLNDEQLEVEDFMNDILNEVKEWIDYHQQQVNKANSLYVKLGGES
jgi:hypothetical protein|tara:strand:+ start:305 stop:508 length:204 start_codon:yes stop_codon:yes gene_type:complete